MKSKPTMHAPGHVTKSNLSTKNTAKPGREPHVSSPPKPLDIPSVSDGDEIMTHTDGAEANSALEQLILNESPMEIEESTKSASHK